MDKEEVGTEPNSLNEEKQNKDELESLPLLEHLRELRTRLIYSFIYLLIGTVIAYNYSGTTLSWLHEPYYMHFPKNSMIGTNPAEAFLLKLKVAFFAGIIIVSPFLFHQVWLFIAPGLFERERKMIIPFIFSSTALFSLGVWLCYKLIMPVTYSFFAEQFTSINLTPQIRISEHLSITIKALIGFGIAFELPVLSYFLGRFSLVTHKQLISWLRYSILGAFVVAAVLTPTPDIITQSLFALPLIFIYLFSIGSCWLGEKSSINKS
jgi:sec-independent protein translocase protein TatC